MKNQQLSEIFKAEYSNLVAVLCHYYGTDMQSAEDIVSETFLNAMKSWSIRGVPESPKAWLRRVAQNNFKDQYRRTRTFDQKIAPMISESYTFSTEFEITEEVIEDSQLKMLFVVCDPSISSEVQICLALRVLCGFNILEIAKALISNKEAINKKLYRGKKKIKEQNVFGITLTMHDYIERLDSVLRVIYLLFNEGYYSTVKESNIKEEVCWEAMRLCKFLADHRCFPKSKIKALTALMCFHASRLSARTSPENTILLYDQQDRSKWDVPLINKGRKYLHEASKGVSISKYHLEAAIAYWHTESGEDKWKNILQCYNRLLMIEYSPIVAMNRTYALARANSIDEAIVQAQKLDLKNNHLYCCLLAELYRMSGDFVLEVKYLTQALDLPIKESERALIMTKIQRAQNESHEISP